MGPAGFAAVIAGWTTAEVGRQPWVVWGVMRTASVGSPITRGEVSASLVAFLAIYAVVFTAGALYILRILGQGPAAEGRPPAELPRAPGSPMAAAPDEPS